MSIARSVLEDTPIGPLLLQAEDNALVSICFGKLGTMDMDISIPVLQEAEEQLHAYFSGDLKEFTVPLKLKGTAFQLRVWQELQLIPWGKTCSYVNIAKALGNPKASRAIGMANNRNPIPIIIPCHRVVGANGSMVGYAGGLDIKRKLLSFEKAQGELFL